ncbi:MAG: ABC transporter ATP-binding protein [Silicimonas sp.]|nr:ABC transporter ATP-binding protein [Silicimonas sp.]
MAAIVQVENLTKTYDGGFTALKDVSLDIQEGEILALLGPNGAGKTTLISTICGISNPTSGRVRVGGHDVIEDWRAARSLIGLVPQEIRLEPFEIVGNTVRFSRGLFGKSANPAFIDEVLHDLSLYDKRNARTAELSGGMRRRVLIAKALAHEPRVLFLDEPTAGVDVELRRDMWRLIERLRGEGVTIILTTHYIEEAEMIADRIGVIRSGELLLVEEKADLMRRLGRKELTVELHHPVETLPDRLAEYDLTLSGDGRRLVYGYKAGEERTGITRLLSALQAEGMALIDLQTRESSLEDIFVDLVQEGEGP